ncbi:MAG TPA: ATP-binding protein [Terriglobales bacterium]|nr:ATP-binding protein [Terriglobales bacterium]
MPAATPQFEFDADKLLVRLNLTFAADPSAISDVAEGVLRVLKAMDCACGHEFEVETALRESLTNAVIHGCKGDAGKKVQICVACDESRGMLIVVRDPGGGFDPAALPDPLLAENLFSDHGRGVYLINQLMDEVQFHHGGTEIHMRKFPKQEELVPGCGFWE